MAIPLPPAQVVPSETPVQNWLSLTLSLAYNISARTTLSAPGLNRRHLTAFPALLDGAWRHFHSCMKQILNIGTLKNFRIICDKYNVSLTNENQVQKHITKLYHFPCIRIYCHVIEWLDGDLIGNRIYWTLLHSELQIITTVSLSYTLQKSL
jgi:hypothetical protein